MNIYKMASQILGTQGQDAVSANYIVGKVITATNAGSSGGVNPAFALYNPQGSVRVIDMPVEAGGLMATEDYHEAGTWDANKAYPQGSWVSYSGSNWIRSAAGLSVMGVVPSAPDWTQCVAGHFATGPQYTTLDQQLPTQRLLYVGSDAKASAPGGPGTSSLLCETEFVPAAVGPPAVPAYSYGKNFLHSSLTITAPNAPAPVVGGQGIDAFLELSAQSIAGVRTSVVEYMGAGNPGGGAEANAWSIDAYHEGSFVSGVLATTAIPAAAAGATPVLINFLAPQQSGVETLATGATASAAIPIAGLSATSIVMATNAGIVGTGLVDAAFDAIADTTSTPGSLILRTSVAVAAAAGVEIKWFIVKL